MPVKRHPPASGDAADLEAELARIAAMKLAELRDLWQRRRGGDPPVALSRDMLARALGYWLQEERLGGLDPHVRAMLDALADKKTGAPVRRVKPGSVIVREFRGVTHEVMVVPDGFSWQGGTYSSLSAIAGRITGTSWNGPRFFGLRDHRRKSTGREFGPPDPGAPLVPRGVKRGTIVPADQRPGGRRR